MKKLQILCMILLLSLVIPSLSSAKAQVQEKCIGSTDGITKCGPTIQNIENSIKDNVLRIQNRQNNIERIKDRITSTSLATTSTSTLKRLDNLDNRLQKQKEQMVQAKDRLLNKEIKIAEILGKIADKIQARIDILIEKGLDLTAAEAKLAEADAKIQELIKAGDDLAVLIATEITEDNKDSLFTDIKSAQKKIRDLAFDAHRLLVDTIKEITKVLPNRPATTTATTTN